MDLFFGDLGDPHDFDEYGAHGRFFGDDAVQDDRFADQVIEGFDVEGSFELFFV